MVATAPDRTEAAEQAPSSPAPARQVSTYGQPRPQALRLLLEAGVHFGHQAKRWNPKMKRHIFGERNGIHILDLQQTVYRLEDAQKFIADTTSRGGKILFVGTKKQATDIVEREALRSNQYFINRRWMGGTLTNFVTIRSRLRVLKNLQGQLERGEFDYLPKQEAAKKLLELEKLEKSLGGMRDMTQLPSAVFIIDTRREQLAVHEARRLGIPVIALTDSNADPDDADYAIPANDDAIRALRLLAASIADAAIDGTTRFESRGPEAQAEGGRGRRGGDGPVTAEDFANRPARGQQQAGGRQQRPAQPAAPAPAEQSAPAEVTAPAAVAAEVPAAEAAPTTDAPATTES
ncbi:MAG TPA: 30S ribosomal protein S2 [Thermomicrobiales bacterium]|jgi:small subunit ribosomal protein S2|nr:30S ribosomal protein S2 [Thermomicrobiales bacterium]